MNGGQRQERPTDAIKVGARIRREVGPLDDLIGSVSEFGILQAITITVDDWLVCGLRRLETARLLALPVVPVLVRVDLTTELHRLLAEQQENAIRKALNPVEASVHFEELLAVFSEQARHRQLAALGHPVDGAEGGAANFAERPGRARDQAAAFVGYSHETMAKVVQVRRAAEDSEAHPAIRNLARSALAAIEDTGKVDGPWRQVREAQQSAHAVAGAALARLGDPAAPRPTGAAPTLGVRSFVDFLHRSLEFGDRYVVDDLASRLTAEQWALVRRWRGHADAFLDELLRHAPEED